MISNPEMKRRIFFRIACSMGLVSSIGKLAQANESRWVPLEIERAERYPGLINFLISEPRKYFLTENFIQRSVFLDSDGNRHRPVGGMMMALFCGNIEIDFRGHTLGADTKMGGVQLNVPTNVSRGKRNAANSASLDNRNIVLRNGIIDLARGNDTGNGVVFSDVWHGRNRRTVGRPDDGTGKPLNFSYTRNDYRLDAMKILANKVGVVMEGSHTVIRNCTVESADLAAIFIAGDHVLIENCEIRLRKSDTSSKHPRAAIVLRDGSNGVIRNNRIRVDYGSNLDANTYCILVRDGAVDVLIENNIFINVRENPVVLTEGATAVVRENKHEIRFF